jgi:hypothetical protein
MDFLISAIGIFLNLFRKYNAKGPRMFLGSHPNQNGLFEKLERRKEISIGNPFYR